MAIEPVILSSLVAVLRVLTLEVSTGNATGKTLKLWEDVQLLLGWPGTPKSEDLYLLLWETLSKSPLLLPDLVSLLRTSSDIPAGSSVPNLAVSGGKVVVAQTISSINMGDSVILNNSVVAFGAPPRHSEEDSPPPNCTQVRVFFATDRKHSEKGKTPEEFGAGRSYKGELKYGICNVSIPKKHKLGKLETPSILRLEFRPDPSKHIMLLDTSTVSEREFLKRVRESTSRSAARDAFVFVHGYNVSFEDAARRTGQIAFDLDFVGAPIFYSWPSNGTIEDYLADETNITWSTPHFQQFLQKLAHHGGAEKIHIIAHSMGNRAVCDALKALSYDKDSQIKFNHLLLAAPDIDAETFRELAEALQKVCRRVTLYESSSDKAIQASKKIHGNSRAGEPILVVKGMETIDATAVDTDFLGHSYFSDTWPLLSDFHSILFDDKPAAGRFGLAPVEHRDGRYYAFKR